jgi:dipeptidyl aminopeptidase/acylaminoacyl peptidase
LDRYGPSYIGTFGWFQDSRHLARLGTPPGSEPHLTTFDLQDDRIESWHFAPGVPASFRELVVGVVQAEPLVVTADARALCFAGRSSGVMAIWKLDLDPDTRTVVAGPHRMTTTTEDARGITIARGTGDIAFTVGSRTPQVSGFPLDRTGRHITGPAETLSSSTMESNYPTVTPDGRRLVFNVNRTGRDQDLRLRDVSEQADRILRVNVNARGEARTTPQLSPDGQRVAFRYIPPDSLGPGRSGGNTGPQQLRWIDIKTDLESNLTGIADGVILPNGWSPDGQYLVATFDQKWLRPEVKMGMAIGLLPLEAAPDAERKMKIVTTSGDNLWQPALSPNGRRMAFRVQGDPRQIAIVESRDGQWNQPQDQSRWQFLKSDGAQKDKPRWSIDGRVLYYVSDRGGLVNVWGVPFERNSGNVGAPFQVTSFDGLKGEVPTDLGNFELALARDRLVIPTIRATSVIWLLQRPADPAPTRAPNR